MVQATTGAGNVIVAWSTRHWTAYCSSSLSWTGSPEKSMRSLPANRQRAMNS